MSEYKGFTKYNPKQIIALRKLNNNQKVYYNHYGGSRSGKTVLDCRYFVLRAAKYPNTRQLICRASKASCITSVWMQTLLPMLEKDCKGIWQEDKSKRIIQFVNGSSLWAGGFDNVQHTDELLAKEWAGILVEEASELFYHNFTKLITRLNWNPKESPIPLKMILEHNPPPRSHWTFQYFINNIDYETKEKLNNGDILELENTHFIPEDNTENLNPKYLKKIQNLKGSAKNRFHLGIYSDSTEGQVYDSFDRNVNLVDKPIEYDPNAEHWRSWDFGINPANTAMIWWQLKTVPESEEFPDGYRIDILHEYENNNLDYKHYSDYCKDRKDSNDYRDAGDPAGHSRNESLESWVTKLNSEGIIIETPKGRPSIDDYISNSNLILPYVRICESETPRIVEVLENWCKPKDRDGQIILGSKPEHNDLSHYGTSAYYWFMVRFPYKESRVYLP